MDEARLGHWEDYDRRLFDRHQVLATDLWSHVMTGVVATCITLSSPYVFELVSWFANASYRSIKRLRHRGQRENEDENRRLLEQPVEQYGATQSSPNNSASDLNVASSSGTRHASDETARSNQHGYLVGNESATLHISGDGRETVWGVFARIDTWRGSRLERSVLDVTSDNTAVRPFHRPDYSWSAIRQNRF